MIILVSVTLFILGAIIASFAGVVAGRVGTGQSFITGRSRCDACNAHLKAFDLVPVISYLASNARARCCGARISVLAPVSELVLGALFVLAYLHIGLTVALLPMLFAISALLALVLYDLAHQILPPVMLAIFVIMSAITGLSLSPSLPDFITTVFVALAIAVFLALIHFLSRGRAMGLADAPLAFGLALLVGSYAFTGFVFSFWIGAVIGIALLLKRAPGTRMGVEVPFAPYLAAGFLLAYFTQWNLFLYIGDLL